MDVTFRPASEADFDFCARLYGEDLPLYIPDPAAQAAKLATLRPRWQVGQARIIQRDGIDVGWIQIAPDEDALFIVQFFVDSSLRGTGIGSAAIRLLIGEAEARERAITLEVMKRNRARSLYERCGFATIGESGEKYRMRRRSG